MVLTEEETEVFFDPTPPKIRQIGAYVSGLISRCF